MTARHDALAERNARIIALGKQGLSPAAIWQKMPEASLSLIKHILCKARAEGHAIPRFNPRGVPIWPEGCAPPEKDSAGEAAPPPADQPEAREQAPQRRAATPDRPGPLLDHWTPHRLHRLRVMVKKRLPIGLAAGLLGCDVPCAIGKAEGQGLGHLVRTEAAE